MFPYVRIELCCSTRWTQAAVMNEKAAYHRVFPGLFPPTNLSLDIGDRYDYICLSSLAQSLAFLNVLTPSRN